MSRLLLVIFTAQTVKGDALFLSTVHCVPLSLSASLSVSFLLAPYYKVYYLVV